MRILVVEDNPKFSALIRKALEEQSYIVDETASGHEGEELGASAKYDAIVLDVMLPDQDGLQVCRNLRRRKIFTPVLLLTSLSQTDEKVAGLDAGADDYLTKPFELDELLARVRALLRRASFDEGKSLKYDDLEMDLVKRSVKRGEKPISLTAKEFALLEYFLRNQNRVLSRALIGERVWDMAFEEESNVIDVYVSRLRSKVDKGFERPLIHTVIGMGYILSRDGVPG